MQMVKYWDRDSDLKMGARRRANTGVYCDVRGISTSWLKCVSLPTLFYSSVTSETERETILEEGKRSGLNVRREGPLMLLKETMATWGGGWMLIDVERSPPNCPDLDALILESTKTQLPSTIGELLSSIGAQERMETTLLGSQAELHVHGTQLQQ